MAKNASGFLVKNVLKHNLFFREGQKGEQAYVLMEGRVEISGTVNGRKKVFAVLKPVSIFGEMAIILEDQQRTATAVALDDCQVVVINKHDLEELIEHSPQIVSTILNVLVHRLKTSTKAAMKAPNLPMGVCRVIDLLAVHGCGKLQYEPMVRGLAEMFVASSAQIETLLAGLAKEGLLKLEATDKGTRSIVVPEKCFMESVVKKKKGQ